MTEQRVPPPKEDVGRNLALLWGPQDRPGRSGLTVRAIIRAATTIADRDGLDALSMRRVADHLGVGTMSLYTHVPGKPALVELMIDAACGELYADLDEPARQPGGWQQALRFIAERNFEWYLRHPWLLHVLTGRPVLGPHVSEKYEAELRPLDGIGLTDVQMDSVLTLVLAHVEGMARWQVTLGRVRRESGETDDDWWRAQEPALAAVMDGSRFPLAGRVGTAAGEQFQSAGDPAHTLRFGLDRILDGVGLLVGDSRSGPG